MQVCGIMASRRIDEVEKNVFVESSRINSTWGGNLVDMVRATRILEVIEQDKLEEHARTMGDMLLGGLKELASMDDRFTNVRARGLLAAFDLPSPELRDRFRLACREKGLLVLNSGQRSIRLRPALNVKKAELEHGFSLLRDVQRLLK
jgi:L-lysine 6-transaminase